MIPLLATALFTQNTMPTTLSSPPAYLHLDPFYKKYLNCGGIAVVSSAKCPDAALLEVRRLAFKMLEKSPNVRKQLAKSHVRIAVMAQSEQTLDIPEDSDLQVKFPDTDWNKRARGLGPTKERPVCSCAEENLLGYANDRYKGESIFVHEFAHAILDMGMTDKDAGFVQAVRDAYDDAMRKSLWKNTYSATNYDEYWAEGVQCWFDCCRRAPNADGNHNEVATREDLKRYDPTLAALIGQVFSDDAWRYSLPTGPRHR